MVAVTAPAPFEVGATCQALTNRFWRDVKIVEYNDDRSFVWVEDVETEVRTIVDVLDLLTPERKIVESWSPEQKRKAEAVVTEYQRKAWRHTEPLPADFYWRHEMERVKHEWLFDQNAANAAMLAHREARQLFTYELEGWMSRQSAFLRHRVGSAAVLQPAFEKWMKKIDKGIPSNAAAKPFANFEKVSRNTVVPIFQTITLDFADNLITAYVWSVKGGSMGLATVYHRLPCAVAIPFTCRVLFDDLKSYCEWLNPERIDFSLDPDGQHLIIQQARSRSRLALIPMNPFTVGYWKGFAPDAEETD